MKCKNCQCDLLEDALFCDQCGMQVNASSACSAEDVGGGEADGSKKDIALGKIVQHSKKLLIPKRGKTPVKKLVVPKNTRVSAKKSSAETIRQQTKDERKDEKSVAVNASQNANADLLDDLGARNIPEEDAGRYIDILAGAKWRERKTSFVGVLRDSQFLSGRIFRGLVVRYGVKDVVREYRTSHYKPRERLELLIADEPDAPREIWNDEVFPSLDSEGKFSKELPETCKIVKCPDCKGSGCTKEYYIGYETVECPACHGYGLGCVKCGGRGTLEKKSDDYVTKDHSCLRCSGKGQLKRVISAYQKVEKYWQSSLIFRGLDKSMVDDWGWFWKGKDRDYKGFKTVYQAHEDDAELNIDQINVSRAKKVNQDVLDAWKSLKSERFSDRSEDLGENESRTEYQKRTLWEKAVVLAGDVAICLELQYKRRYRYALWYNPVNGCVSAGDDFGRAVLEWESDEKDKKREEEEKASERQGLIINSIISGCLLAAGCYIWHIITPGWAIVVSILFTLYLVFYAGLMLVNGSDYPSLCLGVIGFLAALAFIAGDLSWISSVWGWCWHGIVLGVAIFISSFPLRGARGDEIRFKDNLCFLGVIWLFAVASACRYQYLIWHCGMKGVL